MCSLAALYILKFYHKVQMIFWYWNFKKPAIVLCLCLFNDACWWGHDSFLKMAKLSSEETYMIYSIFIEKLSWISIVWNLNNQWIYTFLFLFMAYFRDLNITYVVSIATGFVFEESHAKTLKNSNKILLRIKVLFKNVYFLPPQSL